MNMLECFNNAKKVIYINEGLYNYNTSNNSTTRSKITIKHLSLVKNVFFTYSLAQEKYKSEILNSLYKTSIYICSTIVNEKSLLENKEIFIELKNILKINKLITKK